jgi:hypothetical protein
MSWAARPVFAQARLQESRASHCQHNKFWKPSRETGRPKKNKRRQPLTCRSIALEGTARFPLDAEQPRHAAETRRPFPACLQSDAAGEQSAQRPASGVTRVSPEGIPPGYTVPPKSDWTSRLGRDYRAREAAASPGRSKCRRDEPRPPRPRDADSSSRPFHSGSSREPANQRLGICHLGIRPGDDGPRSD